MNSSPGPVFTGRLVELVQSVRWRFNQAPDDHLSVTEAQKLWPIRSDQLVALFETFVDVGFLQRVGDGVYRRRPDEVAH